MPTADHRSGPARRSPAARPRWPAIAQLASSAGAAVEKVSDDEVAHPVHRQNAGVRAAGTRPGVQPQAAAFATRCSRADDDGSARRAVRRARRTPPPDGRPRRCISGGFAGVPRGVVEDGAQRIVDGEPVLLAHPVAVAPDDVGRVARRRHLVEDPCRRRCSSQSTSSGTGTQGACDDASATCAKSGAVVLRRRAASGRARPA